LKFTFLLIFAMLLWGGGWTALKILTVSVGVEVLSLWRFIIMFFSFIPILFFLNEPLRLPKASAVYIFSSSILNVLFMVFAYLGVERSTAGSGGVIITVLSPLFTFVLSGLVLSFSYEKKQYVGLFIGLIGGAVMLDVQNFHGLVQGGEFYFILAAMTWAGITLLAQKSHSHIHPVHYSFFIAGFSMIILFLVNIFNDISVVFEQDLNFWLALLYLGILGQTVATTVYFIASGKLGSGKASSFMFLVPLFALVVSYMVLDESIQMHIVIGGCVSLFSVYLINKKRA